MTIQKFNRIKAALATLMKEFEDVPEREQQQITMLTTTVQEDLAELSQGLNKVKAALTEVTA